MNDPAATPRGHPTVRRQGARCGRLGFDRRPIPTTYWTRPRSTTPSRGPGPRSRTCTRRPRSTAALAAARWQGAGGRTRQDDVSPRSTTRPPEPGPHSLCRPGFRLQPRGAAVGWHRADDGVSDRGDPGCVTAALYDPRTGSLTTASSMLRCDDESSFTLLLDGTVLVAGGSDCNDDQVYVCFERRGGAVRPCRRVAAAVAPSRARPRQSSRARRRSRRRSRRLPVPFRRTLGAGTSRSTTRAPSPRRCSWPRGTERAFRLVGSATPNVVPAGATMKVTFLFPAKGG